MSLPIVTVGNPDASEEVVATALQLARRLGTEVDSLSCGRQLPAALSRAEIAVAGASAYASSHSARPGALATWLLSGSPCPVMVVPSAFIPARLWPQRVVVAFEPGDEGGDAVAFGARLSRSLGSRLEVITVGDAERDAPPYEPTRARRAAHRPTAAARARALEAAICALPDALDAEGVVLEGAVVPTLAAAARREGDLLVLGSQHGAPRGVVRLGHTAAAVLRAVDLPVLIVSRRDPTKPTSSEAALAAAELNP